MVLIEPLRFKLKLMPNNKEFAHSFLSVDDYSGGALYGEVESGSGIVTLTNRGEFVHDLTAHDELMAGFPEHGLILVYDEKGNLDLASISLISFIEGLSVSDTKRMPNRGKDLVMLRDWLVAENISAILTVKVKEGSCEIVLNGEGPSDFARYETTGMDFRKGYEGMARINDFFSIPICASDKGDEFVLGIGEIGNGRVSFGAFAISRYVDFWDEVTSGGPKDLQKLAGKIILN